MATIDYNALALSPLLVGLRENELEALIGTANEVAFSAGQVIVAEGTPGDTMFMLCEGTVVVEKLTVPDRVVELTYFEEAGEFFGEMVFVDVLPRSATIRAKTDVILLSFCLDTLRTFFEAFADAHLSITLNIARMLSKRLRRADEQIALLMAERE